MTNGYRIIQVSALGRRSTGALYAGKVSAQSKADDLNKQSTGERYEVEWFIGMPRDLAA
jgi:hypothetical protein